MIKLNFILYKMHEGVVVMMFGDKMTGMGIKLHQVNGAYCNEDNSLIWCNKYGCCDIFNWANNESNTKGNNIDR